MDGRDDTPVRAGDRGVGGDGRDLPLAGFAVAIEGAIYPPTMEEALARSGLDGRWIGIELHPRPEVALERNRSRDTKPFDTSILEDAIGRIDADIAAAPIGRDWTRLDNSDESLEETVERVIGLWRQSD